MNETMQRYAAANQPLRAVIDAVPAHRWSAPSPCEGWGAADVVKHMVNTQRDFFTERGLDLGAAPEGDPAAVWREHTRRAGDLLSADAVVDAGYDGYFGPTTIGATLVQFYVWDMLVHRWDIATATGLDATFTSAELDLIDDGADSFGESLYAEGICRPGVKAATTRRQDLVLARLGRRRG